ncbi:villin-4-like [Olea europaea subsp. europaea]|uniref:Villin-4-like n=1 Tax=Olea europaea subsp. europaea TaxID=158383 RepID=A0A8S0TBP7_OLEEU|nr:villin-4-like [Olea europaea subsp. europaea]
MLTNFSQFKDKVLSFLAQNLLYSHVASSLNSSYCYILHSGSFVFSWSGNLTTSEDQELVERQLDLIKPDMQSRLQKEGAESEQFWDLLGGKSEYPSQKIARDAESDPHLFSCNFSKGVKKKKIHFYNIFIFGYL